MLRPRELSITIDVTDLAMRYGGSGLVALTMAGLNQHDHAGSMF
jgi:hypothetical protein